MNNVKANIRIQIRDFMCVRAYESFMSAQQRIVTICNLERAIRIYLVYIIMTSLQHMYTMTAIRMRTHVQLHAERIRIIPPGTGLYVYVCIYTYVAGAHNLDIGTTSARNKIDS